MTKPFNGSFSNLRSFSLDGPRPTGGHRLPYTDAQTYLHFLDRRTRADLMGDLAKLYPAILNQLSDRARTALTIGENQNELLVSSISV